jgi:hypothetical protein
VHRWGLSVRWVLTGDSRKRTISSSTWIGMVSYASCNSASMSKLSPSFSCDWDIQFLIQILQRRCMKYSTFCYAPRNPNITPLATASFGDMADSSICEYLLPMSMTRESYIISLYTWDSVALFFILNSNKPEVWFFKEHQSNDLFSRIIDLT